MTDKIATLKNTLWRVLYLLMIASSSFMSVTLITDYFKIENSFLVILVLWSYVFVFIFLYAKVAKLDYAPKTGEKDEIQL